MDIIIVGCGKVGTALAKQLRKENHNITIVDTDRSSVEALINTLDVQAVYGNGTTYRVLKRAGVDTADLLIAVTGYDERNMLSCLVARKASRCQVIARVRDPEYNEDTDFLKDELGLSMVINPEMAAAANIFRLLQIPSALDVDYFEKSQVSMLCFRVESDSPLNGHNMFEIGSMMKSNMLVCIRERDGEAEIPSGNTTLLAGDKISVMIPMNRMRDVLQKLKLRQKPVRNCLIGGGSATAQYLTGMLLHEGVQVKIIDRDRVKCDELSDKFPDAEIVCGDCTDKQLLAEEGLDRTDAFVCLTSLDEVNIMLSLYASSVSKAKIVSKISRTDFEEVVDRLNIGSVIYPKNITAESIVQYVRALENAQGNNAETLYQLADGKVEAMEFEVHKREGITGIPLMDMRLKKGLLIASITRKGRHITPSGQDTLEEGDTIILLTTNPGIRDLANIIDG
ncbi:MAG: Trk system potassium transporter TrkA [Lachnospiraceae bacterium]|nr:Trk system potassium transporter TrkA [Lachnospiraceae bacterium]